MPRTDAYIFGKHININDDTLDFVAAHAAAKEKARDIAPESMMLSWINTRTGEYYPKYECGVQEKPAWVIAAESKGADLTIDVNNGDFRFIFSQNPGL